MGLICGHLLFIHVEGSFGLNYSSLVTQPAKKKIGYVLMLLHIALAEAQNIDVSTRGYNFRTAFVIV